jgi:hypothetical protein
MELSATYAKNKSSSRNGIPIVQFSPYLVMPFAADF